MTEDELIETIRRRIADPMLRTDTEEAPPLYGAASTAAMDAAAAEVGFLMPAPLQRLYTEVANGGFGPTGGLIGVEGGHTDVDGRNIGSLYVDLRTRGWPDGILPIGDWGGGAWACIDRRDGCIVTMYELGPTRTRFTLSTWLEAWVSGTDLCAETFEVVDGIAMNPFTGKAMSVKRRGRAKRREDRSSTRSFSASPPLLARCPRRAGGRVRG